MVFNGSAMLYLGAALMVLAVVCAVIAALAMYRKRKKLDAQLQLEYGPKNGKRHPASGSHDNAGGQ